jgi:hypothetical protein
VKKFQALYGTGKLMTVFTRDRHQSLSRATYIQSISPLSISLGSLLILSFHLRLGFQSSVFPSGFRQKLWMHFPSPTHATCINNLIPPYFITLIMFNKQCKLWLSLLYKFLHPPVRPTYSLAGPNILLRTSIPFAFNLRGSLRVRVQVSHSYRTTGKFIF